MASKPPERRAYSERVQVYLMPSHEKDALVLDLWESMRQDGRRQDFFRDLLWRGIRDAAQRGDIPPRILKRCKVVERTGATPGATPASPPPWPVAWPTPVTTPFPATETPPIAEEAPPRTQTPIRRPDPARPPVPVEPAPDLSVLDGPKRPIVADSKTNDTRHRLMNLFGDA